MRLGLRVSRWELVGWFCSWLLIAGACASVSDGAQPRRLFGRSEPDRDNDAPKKTYYQPRELQKQWPTQNADPAADPKSVSKAITSERSEAGDPLASAKMHLMAQEMVAGIRSRQIDSEFARWRAYLSERVSTSASEHNNSEFDAFCRLKWYDQMMRNPLTAPGRAEDFTRHLQGAVADSSNGNVNLLRTAREKLDLPARELVAPPTGQSIERVTEALARASADYGKALAPLTEAEANELRQYCYSVFVGNNTVGHTLNDRPKARRLCDLMIKLDRSAMLAAGEDLLPLTTEAFRKQLAAIPEAGNVQVPGVSGRVLKKLETPAGAIVVGGRGQNVYQLDELTNVAAVIDLGGDDEYLEGSVSNQRPVLAILDLAGNDTYRGTQPGIQGGAILGVSLLVDWDGDDRYEARDVAQASAIAGVGILIDGSGEDAYTAQRRAQGQALGGVALLLDRGGNDRYRCAMWGQGLGGPLGFALLADHSGDDNYFLGGVYPDSYKETPGLEGWGQGVGAGIRQVANGGLGVLLDGEGDDEYQHDYLAHGGGYWGGLGFLRDFAGNDRHLGSTDQSYSGGSRTQPEYQRFGSGWGCHFAMGFLFDDIGDDTYRGWIMGLGFGWDCSLGVLADFHGNDRYEANSGSTVQGTGAQGSTGVLFDYDGNDVYVGQGQAYAAPSMSYHPLPQAGGNFSFVIDYGGQDEYGCQASNNAITQRGWPGGYLIDRPRADELQPTTETGGESLKTAQLE